MATINPPKSISRKKELREDKVVTLAARAWDFYHQNRKLVYGAAAGLLILVLAIVGYVLYQSQQSAEAEEHLARIIGIYEQGSYQEALDGTPDLLGLLEIADRYGRTRAGNLAHFYAADALYRMGDRDRALEHFQAFDAESDYIGASAVAGQAAIHEDNGEFARAGDLYRRAAFLFENPLSTPQYLMSAGRAYELAGRYSDAQSVYETVKNDYPDSEFAANIEAYIARAAAKQQS